MTPSQCIDWLITQVGELTSEREGPIVPCELQSQLCMHQMINVID